MKKGFLYLFVVLSIPMFGQHRISNENFSINFPGRPTVMDNPFDEGKIYEYSDGNIYTCQVSQVTIPLDARVELPYINLDDMVEVFFENYLHRTGGGNLISQRKTKKDNFPAYERIYQLKSPTSFYRNAKIFICITNYNMYTVAFYYTESNPAYNQYLNSMKIHK